MLKTFIIDNKDVYYVNSKISNAALWTFYSSNNSTKILGRDIKPAVFYYCDLHSCFSWLTHHISVSNFTLSLSFHVTGSRFHYSPPCQSVRPAMAWLWWESTVLYLNISWCLPWHGALAASQYSCRGGVTDSEGDLVCMCVCVCQYHMALCWPPLFLLLVRSLTFSRADISLLKSSEYIYPEFYSLFNPFMFETHWL